MNAVERSCKRKTRYPTERRALSALYALRAKGKRGMDVYRCAFCGDFHLGHVPKEDRAAP